MQSRLGWSPSHFSVEGSSDAACHLLATPTALWKAGHESNPGSPAGASGSQWNSTKPKNNLRPAPRDGMALVPLTDAPASFGTAAVLPPVVIGSAGNADGGLGTRSWAAVSELSASSATVVRAAHATGEYGEYEEFAAACSLQSGSVEDRTLLATRWAGPTPLQRPDRAVLVARPDAVDSTRFIPAAVGRTTRVSAERMREPLPLVRLRRNARHSRPRDGSGCDVAHRSPDPGRGMVVQGRLATDGEI